MSLITLLPFSFSVLKRDTHICYLCLCPCSLNLNVQNDTPYLKNIGGHSLSREAQTSISPATSTSSSWSIPRCSQASQEVISPAYYGLSWDLLPGTSSLLITSHSGSSQDVSYSDTSAGSFWCGTVASLPWIPLKWFHSSFYHLGRGQPPFRAN